MTFFKLIIFRYILNQKLGIADFISRLIAALNGTEYFLASLIPIFIVEKVGRRPLMLFGAVGMSLSMVALAVSDYYVEYRPDHKQGAGIGATVFFFVFNSFFAIGWLGMTWLYPAEIVFPLRLPFLLCLLSILTNFDQVPLSIRAPANAAATSANWIFNFLVVMIAPPMQNHIKYKTYVVFAVM